MEIVMLVCALAAPDVCETRTAPFSWEAASDRVCVEQAMPELARWIGEHPKWRIRRWRCRRAGSETEA